MSKTYECPICYGVNHASKMVCSTCGTIPPQYSVSKHPAKYVETALGNVLNGFLSVVCAIGCDRTERHRTCKRSLRTVPVDYYAGTEN